MSSPPDHTVLLAYLEGELDENGRADVEARLASSAEWRSALEDERTLSTALTMLPSVEPSPQFETRFWARIARERAAREGGLLAELRTVWVRGRLGVGLGLAGAAAAALFLTLRTPIAPPPLGDDVLIAASADFELFQEDVEMLAVIDILEEWDGTEI